MIVLIFICFLVMSCCTEFCFVSIFIQCYVADKVDLFLQVLWPECVHGI